MLVRNFTQQMEKLDECDFELESFNLKSVVSQPMYVKVFIFNYLNFDWHSIWIFENETI